MLLTVAEQLLGKMYMQGQLPMILGVKKNTLSDSFVNINKEAGSVGAS